MLVIVLVVGREFVVDVHVESMVSGRGVDVPVILIWGWRTCWIMVVADPGDDVDGLRVPVG